MPFWVKTSGPCAGSAGNEANGGNGMRDEEGRGEENPGRGWEKPTYISGTREMLNQRV